MPQVDHAHGLNVQKTAGGYVPALFQPGPPSIGGNAGTAPPATRTLSVTFTATVAGWYRFYLGGGGGAGGATGTDGSGGTPTAAGGGSGAFVYKRKRLAAGETVALVVGGGGIGSVIGSNSMAGKDGAATTATFGDGTVLSAGAGSGGPANFTSVTSTGGAGGTASGGDLNVNGAAGGTATTAAANNGASGTLGYTGTPGNGAAGGSGWNAGGGGAPVGLASPFSLGRGGNAVAATAGNQTVVDLSAPGLGAGGGACIGNTSATAGSGGAGYVVVLREL